MGGIVFASYGLGLVIGFAAGIGVGISIGKKQKPWSELTAAEKKKKDNIHSCRWCYICGFSRGFTDSIIFLVMTLCVVA